MATDRGAFVDATKYKFMAMMEAATFRLEHQMLYGGSGLGIVASANDGADTITISDASWSVGAWAGQEGAQIDIYDTTGATLRVSTAIIGVNASTKTISLTAGTDLSTVVATDVVWFKGSKGNEMTGLRSIVSSTGTLYGISGASYSLWTGNSFAVSGNLTLKKIYQGLINPVGKGLMESVDVLVSPATFATLANDQASLRQYNTAPTTAENGVETIKFHGVNGVINVIVHPLIREGEAMAYPTKKAERIGASDLSFKTPGLANDEMFLHAPNNAGYECRLYSEQALFLPCPGKCVLFTGVTNA